VKELGLLLKKEGGSHGEDIFEMREQYHSKRKEKSTYSRGRKVLSIRSPFRGGQVLTLQKSLLGRGFGTDGRKSRRLFACERIRGKHTLLKQGGRGDYLEKVPETSNYCDQEKKRSLI